MNKQFWTNFFRKDLNLGSRWWHRLFLVIFFAALVWALYVMLSSIAPRWKIVGSVNERITTEVRQIGDLKKRGERVEEKDRSYALNSSTEGHSLYADFYCSRDLANKISEVRDKSNITNLYIREIYGRNNVPIEVFANYVRDHNLKCLIPDSFTYSGNVRVEFLEPLGPNSLFGKDLVFYEKSNLLTVFHILKTLLLVVAVFAGIAIVYHKVFLYIVFGNKKSH